MSTPAIAALARLGKALVQCAWCKTSMPEPSYLEGHHHVLWVQGRRRRYDQFHYVCSPRCRARIKEGKLDG